MVVLFLHGKEGSPRGTKPTHLARNKVTVIGPALPTDDFAEAVRIAQSTFDEHKPDVVVGSSRGGAAAMNIHSGDAGLVLLCPAWKKWGTANSVKPRATVIHSRADDVVPLADSEELIANSGIPAPTLIEIGCDHRLSSPDALEALLIAVRAESIPPNATRISATDLRFLVLIERELLRGDLTPERRQELQEARGDIGEAYAHDWLWDEPEFRDDPDNPRRNSRH